MDAPGHPGQRAVSYLQTLRHLPPGTEFTRPHSPDEQALLHDLLSLGDDADPLAWLVQERRQLTAQIALHHVLLKVKCHVSRGRRRAANEEVAAEGAFLGAIISLEEDAEPFILVEAASISPDTLRRALRQLQAARHLPPESVTVTPDLNEWQRLASELLDLAESADPLHWIAEERPAVAAREVLGHAIAQCRRPREFIAGEIIEQQFPTAVVEVPRSPARQDRGGGAARKGILHRIGQPSITTPLSCADSVSKNRSSS
jgi:hypothetical protein